MQAANQKITDLIPEHGDEICFILGSNISKTVGSMSINFNGR